MTTEETMDDGVPPEAPPDAVEVFKRRVGELKIVPDYKVAGPEEARWANDQLARVKGLAQDLKAAVKAERDPLNAALAAITERWKPAVAIMEQAESTLNKAILLFKQSERLRIEAEQAEANRVAALERARLEEQARKAREAAAEKAAALEAAGNVERAAAVLANAERLASAKEAIASTVVAPLVAPTKLAGSSTRKTWTAKVGPSPKNLKTFLAALAAQDMIDPAELVDVKPAGLKRLAGMLKDRTEILFPGLLAWEDESNATRAIR
jgi:hypothetical protein